MTRATASRQPAFVAPRSNPLRGFDPAGFNQAQGEPDWFQEYEQWLDETQPETDE